ncbi:oligomeric complex COG6 [Pseudovirgaria hyperparasitica]|uniref:Conserved oligomeric Golgi complex subunit 6 n=1 Tax=Pseudovirgaria hyperparasitica TaxID=470096 RepID=A0A6A6VWY4_9PEZI|nr:oligomeric complex COG6 [Pseudovirgaria hyperparasitica]KAF2753767.1 oligomeric complex COG6 [Pseudovirgaria hyperparasitica]
MTSYLQERTLRPGPSPDALGISSPGTPSQGVGPRANALSSRITSVLSASYSDLDIRDALETLDARGIKNNQETRRRLRLDVQKEVIQCNADIIKDFGQVAAQLRRIGVAIENLNRCCDDMRAHINASNRESAPVLEEASSLFNQKVQVETKAKLLDVFNSHFIISERDVMVLTSTSEPVNDEFFQVLTRVKKIHSDCQILLGSENQVLGLELLEQSSKQLNAAFQKLYRWIQREFKNLDLENPQINASIRRSIRVLAERPALFQSCLDAFAGARENILSESFYNALTGTGESQMKPIEFQAHDPLRYIGDMLAWAHSAAVSEKEALEVLFVSEGDEIARSIKLGLESEPWTREDGEESGQEAYDGRKALNELVSHDLKGVARLLRQRTEQVTQSHDDPVLVYKIANLVAFYRSTFKKLVGEDSEVLEILDELQDSAFRRFKANMQDHLVTVQSDLGAAPEDLSPPEFLTEALNMLKALLTSYDTSMATADDQDSSFQPVLTEALDPCLNACEKMYKSLTEPENDVFAINCLMQTRATLTPFTFTGDRITELGSRLNKHASNLVAYQHRYLLDESGLNTLIFALGEVADSKDSIAKIPTLPPFSPDSLVAISQKLDDFLPSALMDARENVKCLNNAQIAQDITEHAADKFCEDFEAVEEKILAVDEMQDGKREDEEEPCMRDLFPRTSGEIKVLLS